MIKVFDDKTYVKKLVGLSIPIILQVAIITLISTFNTFLLAPMISEGALTGVSSVFNVFFVYNVTIVGVVYTASTIASQYLGKKDYQKVKESYNFLLQIILVISIISFLISILIPEKLVSLFILDEEAIKSGAQYLRIFSITFLFTGFSSLNYTYLKNLGLSKYLTLISLLTLSLSLIVASIFIYATEYKIIGAAIALVVARFIELLFTSFLLYKKTFVKFSFYYFIHVDKTLVDKFIKIGVPLTVSKFIWVIGAIMSSILIGKLSNSAIGLVHANARILIVKNIVVCIADGTSSAVSIIIGKELGANSLKEAKNHSKDITKVIALVGLIDFIVFLLTMPLIYLINTDLSDSAKHYMWIIYLIYSVIYFPQAFNDIYLNGLFVTGGDSKFMLFVDTLPSWLFIVPIGYIAIHCSFPPLLTFTLVSIEEVIKCPFVIIRFKKYKWVKNITIN